MQVSLVNPPQIFARNAAGRLVQIAGRPGELGRFANIVVPDAHEIRRLRPVVRFIESLKPVPFNYGTASHSRWHSRSRLFPTAPSPFNRMDNLPLFENL